MANAFNYRNFLKSANHNEFNYEDWVTADYDLKKINEVCTEEFPLLADRVSILEQKVEEIIETGGINNVKLVDTYEDLPIPGEDNVIYITKDDSKMYYYVISERSYVCLSEAGEKSVISYASWYDFPGVGKIDTVYIDRSTDTLYYFNTDTRGGEQIGWKKFNNENYIICRL